MSFFTETMYMLSILFVLPTFTSKMIKPPDVLKAAMFFFMKQNLLFHSFRRLYRGKTYRLMTNKFVTKKIKINHLLFKSSFEVYISGVGLNRKYSLINILSIKFVKNKVNFSVILYFYKLHLVHVKNGTTTHHETNVS